MFILIQMFELDIDFNIIDAEKLDNDYAISVKLTRDMETESWHEICE